MKNLIKNLCIYIIVFIIVYGCLFLYSQRPIKAVKTPQDGRTAIYRVTAYCAGECCCGRFADGITASGAPAKGKLIAAPKEIPFGTLTLLTLIEGNENGNQTKNIRYRIYYSLWLSLPVLTEAD